VNESVGWPRGSGSARRLAIGWLGMEGEALPVDGGWAQRSRSMWTCDHHSGSGGHFLDGSFGHFAGARPKAFNSFVGVSG